LLFAGCQYRLSGYYRKAWTWYLPYTNFDAGKLRAN